MGYKDGGRCDNCERYIFTIPEWSLRETLVRAYGSPALGADYCRNCALDFVENEIADGYRNSDGSLKTQKS